MNDIPGGAAKRDRFADLLAAAPAVGDAYTLQDIQALSPSPADVKATIESVANFRVGDVLAFMQYWNGKNATSDVTNQPVLATELRTKVAASHARGDSASELSRVVDKAIADCFDKQDATEGNSFYAYGAFRLRVDSSKWGDLAKTGLLEEKDLEFSERGIDIVTTEWRKHKGTRESWMEYSRDLKRNFRRDRRYGLVNQLTAFNDELDAIGDWETCEVFIELYFKEYGGRMPKAKCSDGYLSAIRKIAREQGTPPPAALKAPSGAAALPAALTAPTA